MTAMDDEKIDVSEDAKSFLESALDKLKISHPVLNIYKGSHKGDNYVGNIFKVNVVGSDSEGKTVEKNLILKCASSDPQFRDYVCMTKLFSREVYMYQEVFPEFIKLQQDNETKEKISPFPKYYAASLKESNEAILLEDMKVHGYKLKNRRDPLDLAHTLIVMEYYGKFHALSFALKEQNPEAFKRLQDDTNEIFFTGIAERTEFQEIKVRDFEELADCLEAKKETLAAKKLREYSEVVTENILEVLAVQSAGEYAVITHGDCWINNILFKYKEETGPEVPTEVCFLDWQLSCCGSPALDLSYFIFVCTSEELRTQHYDKLLDTYYSSFSSSLSMMGSDPTGLFPFDVLLQHMKKFSTYGLFMASMLLKLMVSEKDEVPDLVEHAKKEDRDKFTYSTKNMDIFEERLAGVARDFVKLGYL